MFKVKYFNNFIFVRSLFSVNSPYMIDKLNKQNKIKYKADYINYPIYFSTKKTKDMLDQNSRLITVEGNVGVGKEKLAKKIADHFAMRFIEDVFEKDMFVFSIGNQMIDLRQFNSILPPSARMYTREIFWNDENPIKNGKPLLLQFHHYYWRYYNCCKGMAHLFNTGTGLVMDSSPWSDHVMALTLKECGLMSEKAFKLYNLIRCETIPYLWKPNFIVYIKARPEVVRQKLIAKNNWMKNARNISDKFIETYQDIFENKYLEDAKSHSKILTIDLDEYDVDNEDDFHALMESLAKLNVDYDAIDEFDSMFYDWKTGTSSGFEMDISRSYFSSAHDCYMGVIPVFRIPYAMTEGRYSLDDLGKLHAVFEKDDRLNYDVKFNSKYTSWKDIMFPSPQFNYGNFINQPYSIITRAYE